MTKSEEELQNKFAWKAELKEKIEELGRHSDSRSSKLQCSEDGYTSGLDDVLKLMEDNV